MPQSIWVTSLQYLNIPEFITRVYSTCIESKPLQLAKMATQYYGSLHETTVHTSQIIHSVKIQIVPRYMDAATAPISFNII